MRIQVNTDENVEGGEDLSARVAAEIRARLDRGDKSGGSDKRCLIEARLEGRQPEVASEQAATLEGAYSGTAKKLQRALQTTLGRLNRVKCAETIRAGDL